jgi:hypothetical protein
LISLDAFLASLAHSFQAKALSIAAQG